MCWLFILVGGSLIGGGFGRTVSARELTVVNDHHANDSSSRIPIHFQSVFTSYCRQNAHSVWKSPKNIAWIYTNCFSMYRQSFKHLNFRAETIPTIPLLSLGAKIQMMLWRIFLHCVAGIRASFVFKNVLLQDSKSKDEEVFWLSHSSPREPR